MLDIGQTSILKIFDANIAIKCWLIPEDFLLKSPVNFNRTVIIISDMPRKKGLKNLPKDKVKPDQPTVKEYKGPAYGLYYVQDIRPGYWPVKLCKIDRASDRLIVQCSFSEEDIVM